MKILAVIALFVVTVLVSISLAKKQALPTQVEPFQGTILSAHYNWVGGITSTAVRIILTEDKWKETRSYLNTPSGKPKYGVIASDSRAVFQINEDNISPEGHSGKSAGVSEVLNLYRDRVWLRSHPRFVREGEVAGLKTYVFQNKQASGYTRELEFSAELGSLPVRMRLFAENGTIADEEVVIHVQRGNLSEELVAVPDRPINFSALDKKISKSGDAQLRELRNKLTSR